MREILPGIFHWTATHPKIRMEVSSYYLQPERVLLDPLIPQDGLAGFDPPPEQIFLTNRHHYRDCAEISARFGCKIWCSAAGLHEFTHGEEVHPYEFGETLPGGIETIEIGALCPDESALFIARESGCIAVADGVIRIADGPLQFVPDALLGDDPAAVKKGLRQAYGKLLGLDFDTLLLAHGEPLVGGAKQALQRFITGPGQSGPGSD